MLHLTVYKYIWNYLWSWANGADATRIMWQIFTLHWSKYMCMGNNMFSLHVYVIYLYLSASKLQGTTTISLGKDAINWCKLFAWKHKERGKKWTWVSLHPTCIGQHKIPAPWSKGIVPWKCLRLSASWAAFLGITTSAFPIQSELDTEQHPSPAIQCV